MGELWNQSWEILLACYGLLVMIAGVLLMAHESLQARYSVKEIAPRLVVGFLAGALSLFVAAKAIAVANALAHVATVAILQEKAPSPTAVRPRLRSALSSRVVVEQAKGALAYEQGLDLEHAFDELRRRAQDESEDVAEVARALLSSYAKPRSDLG